MDLHWEEQGDPLNPVADPDHLHFEEDLDHSVLQGYRWGTVVLYWEEQGNLLHPVGDPGHAGSC